MWPLEAARVQQRFVLEIQKRRQPGSLVLKHVVRALAKRVPEKYRAFEEVPLVVEKVQRRQCLSCRGLFASGMAVVMQVMVHAHAFVELSRFLTLPSRQGQVPFLVDAFGPHWPMPRWLSGQRLAVLDIDFVVAAPYLWRPLRLDP